MERYTLTKIDVAAIRQCDHFVVAIDGAGMTRVHAIKTKTATERDPFATDVTHAIAAPISVDGYGRYKELPHGARCFGMLWLYRNQVTHAGSILSLLRAGDAVEFHFYPDSHTTQGLAQAGFHGDSLSVIVERGAKVVAHYELASTFSPNNTARMCRGIPSAAWLTAERVA